MIWIFVGTTYLSLGILSAYFTRDRDIAKCRPDFPFVITLMWPFFIDFIFEECRTKYRAAKN